MFVRKTKLVRLGRAKTLTRATSPTGLPEMAGVLREYVGG